MRIPVDRFARPDQHAKIEETLKRIDAEGAAGGGEKAVVYEKPKQPICG